MISRLHDLPATGPADPDAGTGARTGGDPGADRQRPGTAPADAIAVVLGGGAIEVVRPLRLAGIHCAVVAAEHDPVRRAAGTSTVFTWDWTREQSAHDAALAERLVAWALTQPVAPVLFASSDQPMLFLSRFRHVLERGFRLRLADADLVEALADKARFAQLAERTGLPVPRTVVLEPTTAFPAQRLASLGYPLVVKPDRRDHSWREVTDAVGVKVKAVVAESPEELRRRWPDLAALGHTLVAQEFVPGPESAIESYHVYADRDGEVAADFTGTKIRTWPLECGFTTSAAITDQRDVRELGRRLTAALGLRGLAKFDFKRAPDGRLFLLEVNARPSLWHHPGARAGVNLPALQHADLAGLPRPRTATTPEGTRWVHPKDVLAARASGGSVAGWVWFAARSRAKAFWSWRDPRPFGYLIGHGLAGALRGAVGRAGAHEEDSA
jgi:D-aspartate ligase